MRLSFAILSFRQPKFYHLILMIFILTIILQFGCSDDNGHVSIVLPQDTRLEDTKAGWWIKELNLSYDDEKYLTYKIRNKIKKIGSLIDSYTEKKDIVVKKWSIEGYTKSFILLQKESVNYTTNPDGDHQIWFEMPSFYPEGVPWNEMIDDGYEIPKPNRKSEHAVTIESKCDNRARLFLFGWGRFCTSTTLL